MGTGQGYGEVSAERDREVVDLPFEICQPVSVSVLLHR